jgi:hypothetical protein
MKPIVALPIAVVAFHAAFAHALGKMYASRNNVLRVRSASAH